MAPKDLSSHIGRVSADGARAPLAAARATEPELDLAPLEALPDSAGAEAPPRDDDLAPVPFWRRLVAFALDSLVVVALQLALTVTGILWFIDSTHTFTDTGERINQPKYIGPEPWGHDFAPLLTFIVLAFIYEVLFIWKRGQTPGKEKLKIRVTRVADGQLPTLSQAITRSSLIAVLRAVPGTLILVGNLAALVLGVSAPFNLRRRAVHDYLAGTMVVYYDAVAKEGPVHHRRPRAALTDWFGLRRNIAAVGGRSDDLYDEPGNRADKR